MLQGAHPCAQPQCFVPAGRGSLSCCSSASALQSRARCSFQHSHPTASHHHSRCSTLLSHSSMKGNRTFLWKLISPPPFSRQKKKKKTQTLRFIQGALLPYVEGYQRKTDHDHVLQKLPMGLAWLKRAVPHITTAVPIILS